MSPKQQLAAWFGPAAVVVAVAFTQSNEGTILETYRDPVQILTACTGETHYIIEPGDIVEGARFSKEECTEALYRSMWEHAEPVIRCTAPAELTGGQKLAFLDFSFNTGGKTFCNSSIARKAKAGDVRGSCDAILLYRLAGGQDCSAPGNKTCRGVWTRRKLQHAKCIA